jgi:hypothetical protein
MPGSQPCRGAKAGWQNALFGFADSAPRRLGELFRQAEKLEPFGPFKIFSKLIEEPDTKSFSGGSFNP